MKYGQHITLKHLLIDSKKNIGLQFNANKVLNIIIKELDSVVWSDEFNMYYVANTTKNLDAIFNLFRGVAWVDTAYFSRILDQKSLKKHSM